MVSGRPSFSVTTPLPPSLPPSCFPRSCIPLFCNTEDYLIVLPSATGLGFQYKDCISFPLDEDWWCDQSEGLHIEGVKKKNSLLCSALEWQIGNTEMHWLVYFLSCCKTLFIVLACNDSCTGVWMNKIPNTWKSKGRKKICPYIIASKWNPLDAHEKALISLENTEALEITLDLSRLPLEGTTAHFRLIRYRVHLLVPSVRDWHLLLHFTIQNLPLPSIPFSMLSTSFHAWLLDISPSVSVSDDENSNWVLRKVAHFCTSRRSLATTEGLRAPGSCP